MIVYDSTHVSKSFIHQVHLAYKGRVTNPPSSGDNAYKMYLMIANRFKDEWVDEPNSAWASLYEERDQATVSTDIVAYGLDDEFLKPSDFILLVNPNDETQTARFTVSKPRQRNSDGDVFISGNDPQVLTFVNPIDAKYDGWTLRVGGYWGLDDLESDTDEILIDNPHWLVFITAAELSRNDPAKEDQFPNLVGKANDLYAKMIEKNQNSPYLQSSSASIDGLDQIGDVF